MNETEMLREDRRRLAEDLKKVMRDTESILLHKVKDADPGYTQARDQLEETLKGARGQLEALEQHAYEAAQSAIRGTDGYVRRHPWETSGVGLGVGVGIGLLIGLLVGRK